MENLNDVLIEQLKDLYSAETQLVEALPKMAKGSVSRELRMAFEAHLGETKEQVKRLEKIGKTLKTSLDGHTCKAMKGLVKECEDSLGEDYDCKPLKDIMLVAGAQRIEHYEIAGYGNAIALAQHLDLGDIVTMLEQTIEEEGEADKSLTRLCEEELFLACEEEGDEDEDEEEDEDEPVVKKSSKSNVTKLAAKIALGFCLLSPSAALFADEHKDADNTARNAVDKDLDTVLPEDQSNEPALIERTALIRREITDSDTLSTSAQNIKIVTLSSGTVVLRGPVASDAEKATVEGIAKRLSGDARVASFIEVTKG